MMKKNIDYSTKVLQVKGLKKYFYVGTGSRKLTVPAVDNVTFDVYKREVFGLVGESGCGKTTTGRTLIKLYNPTDGTVTFNDVIISAGYRTHLRNIQKIKKTVKENIFLLNPYGQAVLDLKKEMKKKQAELDLEIGRIKQETALDVAKAQEPLEQYKKEKYELKSQYTLECEDFEYHFLMEKNKLNALTQNSKKVEYLNELEIIKHTFNRKVDGIKDSAALDKEIIKDKLVQLRSEYEAQKEALEARFAPLILESEKERMDKALAREQIAQLKVALNENLRQSKDAYEKRLQAIVVPQKSTVAHQVSDIKANARMRILALKDQKKALKLEEDDMIRNLKESYPISEEQKHEIKAQSEALKLQAQEQIREEKDKIKAAKHINSAKVGLDESRKMQMIFQDPISSLNPRMTVKEIVAEGLTIQGTFSKEDIDAKVKNTLELVGLSPEYAARYPHEFSGGQRQRIGIARALIMNPNLIIADEPISALDVSIRAQVINLLSHLKDELDLTIVFIAHDLSVVRFFCDRIAVMYQGRIVELTSSEELFKHPMHPYTISLLSAIPQPDPDYEKGRTRINYNPMMHDYRYDKPSLKEIAPGHLVYANEQEFLVMKEKYKTSEETVS